jgi:hypothetical protein
MEHSGIFPEALVLERSFSKESGGPADSCFGNPHTANHTPTGIF